MRRGPELYTAHQSRPLMPLATSFVIHRKLSKSCRKSKHSSVERAPQPELGTQHVLQKCVSFPLPPPLAPEQPSHHAEKAGKEQPLSPTGFPVAHYVARNHALWSSYVHITMEGHVSSILQITITHANRETSVSQSDPTLQSRNGPCFQEYRNMMFPTSSGSCHH